jgi:Protein of unknown function (DUF2971)
VRQVVRPPTGLRYNGAVDAPAPAPRQPIDIAVLTQFLNSLESYSQDLVQHLRSGQKLCHYTSLEGAIGIISSGDLWLANSRYSNDDEELNYGHRLVETVLDELDINAKTDPPRLDWLRRLRAQVRAAHGDQVYICCFCEKDNLLSQWRGYAENGGGVSIEFDPNGFMAVAGPDCAYGLMRLWKVFYDREQQRKIIRDSIDYTYWPVSNDDERIRFIVDALQFFMPTFKNGDFREEQERRLIFTPYPTALPKPKFRTRRALLVPYFSLRELSEPGGLGSGFKLPVNGVLVGPGLHRALNVESSRMMLAKHGYLDVPVQSSTTPYRG